MTPSLAVVMPAWNAERFIEDAIRSALDQTVPPTTVLIVDDGSDDETAARAAATDASVRVLRQDHAGIGAARNAGVAATASDLVAFLDADDLWLPTKLERQMAVITAGQADAVFCLMDEYYDEPESPPSGARRLHTGVASSLASAALMGRDLVERLGAFPTTPVGEWLTWWARARSLGVSEHVVPEVLLRRRIHGENNSLRRDDRGRTFLSIARAHLHAEHDGLA